MESGDNAESLGDHGGIFRSSGHVLRLSVLPHARRDVRLPAERNAIAGRDVFTGGGVRWRSPSASVTSRSEIISALPPLAGLASRSCAPKVARLECRCSTSLSTAQYTLRWASICGCRAQLAVQGFCVRYRVFTRSSIKDFRDPGTMKPNRVGHNGQVSQWTAGGTSGRILFTVIDRSWPPRCTVGGVESTSYVSGQARHDVGTVHAHHHPLATLVTEPPRHTLRLKPKAPTTGYVDGAWWPRSRDLSARIARA
ncbi:DUF5994 family protein [Kibdelosporangium aridum]|uniref:DUF5994 family protein n=1 Tax=Kibdelosporangium aridum TaxID=2030 RepID=UPI0035EAC224